MRPLQRFEYQQQLHRSAAKICKQMAELLQLRDLVRLAEKRQGTSVEWSTSQSSFQNRRSFFQTPAVRPANIGAYPVLTQFLKADSDTEILLHLGGIPDLGR